MSDNKMELNISMDRNVLLETAVKQTGLSDFGDKDFLEGLDVLLDSLITEADLSKQGVLNAQQAIINTLITKLHLTENEKQIPEITQTPIKKPVFIIGLPRTGSTLLHTLFSYNSSEVRTPALWELLYPATRLDGSMDEAAMIKAAQQYVDDYYKLAPDFKIIHPLAATWPEECHRLLQTSFKSLIFALRFNVPSYVEWLQKQDMEDAYQIHKKQLQHILWRHPGERLVLKNPFHLWELDAITKVYPDACFVQLHRDPSKMLPSLCSLSATIRVARSTKPDPLGVGNFWVEQMSVALDRMMAFREKAKDNTFIDVTYSELVQNPNTMLAKICRELNIDYPVDAAARVRLWLDKNRQHKHGIHKYTPEEFGLSQNGIQERFVNYRERFNLPAETMS